MREGAVLINTARGALVDEEALIAELETGRISAIIDVTDPEIPPAESKLYRLPNVFLTPHIAGAIGTERSRLGNLVVDEIERFVAGKQLFHRVEPALLQQLA
jgi:phosphoglycerate dehydrogenase-like enzyme